MTEAEWLACTEPERMVKSVRAQASDRKRRLFACACCRLGWSLLTDPCLRLAVETSERFADGLATEADLEEAWRAAWRATPAVRGMIAQRAARAAENAANSPDKALKLW